MRSKTLIKLAAMCVTAFLSITRDFNAQDPALKLDVSVRMVSLEVAALDSNGIAMPTLNREDFIVEENGIRQEVRNFAFLDDPVNLLVLFDQQTSGDRADSFIARNPAVIARRERWTATQTFVGETIGLLLRQLRPDDRMAIAGFDEFSLLNRVMDWRGPNRGQAESVKLFRQYLDAWQGGDKDLYGAAKWAVSELQKQRGRKAVVMFTDGRDARLQPVRLVKVGGGDSRIIFDPLYGLPDAFEEEDFQAMIEIVKKSGIPFHVVAIDSGAKPWEHIVSYTDDLMLFPKDPEMEGILKTRARSRLTQLAEASGGHIYNPKVPDDRYALYSEISKHLALERLYSLAYVPTNPDADGSYRRIDVRVNRPNLRVAQSKPGYYAR